MEIPINKQLVCITGSVWTGSRSAPRRLLVKNGFQRPIWFTTHGRINEAGYRYLSETEFHLQNAEGKILAYIEYGGDYIGILKQALESALRESQQGALVVGPQEIAAQIAHALHRTVVFTLKEKGMTLSAKLKEVQNQGRLHRIDVDALQPGAWTEAYRLICGKLGLETQNNPF
jgi:guanylate kinase